MAEFMQWTEAHIISLRESCSASAVDRAITESELWSFATRNEAADLTSDGG
jgi:hypothetical protein